MFKPDRENDKKNNIGIVATVLLLTIMKPPALTQDTIGPLLDNDLKLNNLPKVIEYIRAVFNGTRYLTVWSQVGDLDDPRSIEMPGYLFCWVIDSLINRAKR
jgi:hypothetical protein